MPTESEVFCRSDRIALNLFRVEESKSCVAFSINYEALKAKILRKESFFKKKCMTSLFLYLFSILEVTNGVIYAIMNKLAEKQGIIEGNFK